MFPFKDFKLVSVSSEVEIAALPRDTEAVMVARLSDSKAQVLSTLSSLRVLLSDGSPNLTDRGLDFLSALASLEALDLEWAIFSDVGLHHLARLPRLRWLDITGCRGFSAAGLEAFQTALPGCTVEQ